MSKNDIEFLQARYDLLQGKYLTIRRSGKMDPDKRKELRELKDRSNTLKEWIKDLETLEKDKSS